VLKQFGREMAGYYELARGKDDRSLHLDVPPLRLIQSKQLPEAVDNREQLRTLVRRMAGNLAKMLLARDCHAEGVALTLYLLDGSTSQAGRPAKPPTSDEQHLQRLADDLLNQVVVTEDVIRLTLMAYPLRPWYLDAHQLDLVRGGVPAAQARLEEALRQVRRRFGELSVRIGSLVSSPAPEPIAVRVGADDQPASYTYRGVKHAIRSVHESWLQDGGWWDVAALRVRCFHRVLLPDESYRVIYQDMTTGQWYLERAWPIL
jgi:hypothetical protein